MTIPTGNGSEVLKYAKITALTDAFQTLITGDTNHIITVVSIIFTNQGGDAEKITMAQTDDTSNTNIHYFLNEQDLPGGGTFVWNDKFSWDGTKLLRVATASSADVDVYATYIEQDWS